MRGYEHTAHLTALDAALEGVSLYAQTAGADGIARLIISMPPRHGKSTTTSRLFPLWHFARCPDHRIILASYAASLAEKHSRAARNMLMSDRFAALSNVKIASDSASIASWALQGHDGGMDAIGVGGGVTGKGANIILVDDPISSRQEAESQRNRDTIYDWFTDDLYTRREPGAAVVIIMCMTGDTPVLMATGKEKPLRDICPGDVVATYNGGQLSSRRVVNHTSQGMDVVYRITTANGRTVRANARHPFLTLVDGEMKWTRVRDLKSTQRIVTVQGNGANGEGLRVAQTIAQSQYIARDFARRTTARCAGDQGTARPAMTKTLDVTPSLNIGMGLPLHSTTKCLENRITSAQFASNRQKTNRPLTGKASSASITTTIPVKSEGFSAISVTLPLAQSRTSITPLQWLTTSDFTTERIVSIELAGYEEVFDVQIEETENFIANGIVSHNTRWHADDLVGRILREQGHLWRSVKFPALAEDHDILGRKPGEALWPARFPKEELEATKRTLGDYAFAGLYQQRPVLLEGGLFKAAWLPLVDELPDIVGTVRYWDLAMSSKTSADYTAGVKLGLGSDGLTYVLDVQRQRLEWGDVVPWMAAIILEDGTATPHGVEEKGFMSRAIQELNADSRLNGFTVFGYNVEGDKVTRALPFSSRAAAGMVRVLRRSWTTPYLEEMLTFPLGEHDDQVDATSGAWAMIGQYDYGVQGQMTYAEQLTVDY
jgi:predicted phage terminase large subunit-like protein